jgi:ABC-type glutathione transport system ATPase component
VCPNGAVSHLPMEALLEVNDLNISYRACDGQVRAAVAGVSFQVAPGETVGLMGESGCGKSSVALAIMGLLRKERAKVSGAVLFRGQNLLETPEHTLAKLRGSAISLMYQDPGISLSPVMRVGAQIAEVVHAHKNWTWEKCREEAHSMLARVGLEPTVRIFAAYPHQLSGGQLQRVVLAQALVGSPALVIADEPTASLDARTQSDFIALVGDLKQRSRVSMLLISHTPEIQASLAHRLIVMRDGRIVEAGSFDRLYAHPIDPYTRAMLRRQPRAGAREIDGRHEVTEERIPR